MGSPYAGGDTHGTGPLLPVQLWSLALCHPKKPDPAPPPSPIPLSRYPETPQPVLGGKAPEPLGWGGAIPAVLRDTDGDGLGTPQDNRGCPLSHRFAPEPPRSHQAHPRGLRPATSPGAPGQRERGAGTGRGHGITPTHQKDETSPSHPKNTVEGAGMPVPGGATAQPPRSRSGVRGLKLPELNGRRRRGRPAEKLRRLHRSSV